MRIECPQSPWPARIACGVLVVVAYGAAAFCFQSIVHGAALTVAAASSVQH